MADFDAFENSAPQQTEDDPAADFLAREQDELKGLEDDNFGTENVTGGKNALLQLPEVESLPLFNLKDVAKYSY